MLQQSYFEWIVAVNWNRNSGGVSRLRIDMMAAVDAFQFPTIPFQKTAELLPADRFQNAISMILSFSVIGISFISTDRQPSTAS
jgi:hypothetical protein